MRYQEADEGVLLLDEFSRNVRSSSGSSSSLVDKFNATIIYENKNGRQGSIIRYNSFFLLTIGWALPRTGSIFVWYELLLLISSLSGLATVLALWSCTLYTKEDKCLHLPTADTKFLTLMTLCSFLMAFFANIIYNRWWSIRVLVQQFTGAATSLSMTLSSAMVGNLQNKSPPEIDDARKLANRVNSMCMVAFRFLLNNTRDENNIMDLVNKGYISTDEAEYFQSQPNQDRIYCCQVIFFILQEALRKGYMKSDNLYQLMNQNVMEMKTAIGMIETHINVQIPYPFVQIVAFVFFSFLIQLLVVCASFIALGFSDPSKKDQLATGYLTLLLYSVVLTGLLKLHEVLSNPLGEDAADFPVSTYLTDFEKSIFALTSNGFFVLESNGALGKFTRTTVPGQIAITNE